MATTAAPPQSANDHSGSHGLTEETFAGWGLLYLFTFVSIPTLFREEVARLNLTSGPSCQQ